MYHIQKVIHIFLQNNKNPVFFFQKANGQTFSNQIVFNTEQPSGSSTHHTIYFSQEALIESVWKAFDRGRPIEAACNGCWNAHKTKNNQLWTPSPKINVCLVGSRPPELKIVVFSCPSFFNKPGQQKNEHEYLLEDIYIWEAAHSHEHRDKLISSWKQIWEATYRHTKWETLIKNQLSSYELI